MVWMPPKVFDDHTKDLRRVSAIYLQWCSLCKTFYQWKEVGRRKPGRLPRMKHPGQRGRKDGRTEKAHLIPTNPCETSSGGACTPLCYSDYKTPNGSGPCFFCSWYYYKPGTMSTPQLRSRHTLGLRGGGCQPTMTLLHDTLILLLLIWEHPPQTEQRCQGG